MSGDKSPASPPPAEGGAKSAVEDKKAAAADKPADDVKDEKPAAAAETEAAPAEEKKDKDDDAEEKPAEEESKPDAEKTDDTAAAEGEGAEGDDADKSADKSKQLPQRRKSVSAGGAKGKKLNKKQSKQRVLHLDAKPGDYYFVKLKGFPAWPVIICDEDMLPASLLKTRPVTAKRADGTYREDYADGGKNVADRTFPVMYLHTNEFGWVPNTELIDLDPATVLDVKLDKMRKSLQAAHQLAAAQHPLSYYKEVLQNYQEELIEQEKAKAAKAATPKGKKGKAAAEAASAEAEDEDVEMEDAPEEDTTSKKTKKRKAEGSAETPQRADSVKKPKIKLTTSSTPKAANGASATPKSSGKASETKSTKSSKSKKKDTSEDKTAAASKEPTPKEPSLTPEERHARKEKEVLFLRHKLQKGLLTRDQEPKEEEMELMSNYITKLEGFPDLEVSIIRATKINKVLKAILKLDNIPRESEFKFKERSQVLLDKWNKLLAVDGGSATPAAAAAAGEANGKKANGVEKKKEEEEGEGKEEKGEEKKSEEAVEAEA